MFVVPQNYILILMWCDVFKGGMFCWMSLEVPRLWTMKSPSLERLSYLTPWRMLVQHLSVRLVCERAFIFIVISENWWLICCVCCCCWCDKGCEWHISIYSCFFRVQVVLEFLLLLWSLIWVVLRFIYVYSVLNILLEMEKSLRDAAHRNGI